MLAFLIYTPEKSYQPHFEAGIRSYVHYNSIFNQHVLQIPPSNPERVAQYWLQERVTPRDVHLINTYTPFPAPVMMIGFRENEEWQYFVAAQRLPASPVVPTRTMFSEWQIDTFREKIPGIIYLPANAPDLPNLITYSGLDMEIKQSILPNYHLVEKGDAIWVYERQLETH